MDALGDVTLEGVKSTILVLSGKGVLCNLLCMLTFNTSISTTNKLCVTKSLFYTVKLVSKISYIQV